MVRTLTLSLDFPAKICRLHLMHIRPDHNDYDGWYDDRDLDFEDAKRTRHVEDPKRVLDPRDAFVPKRTTREVGVDVTR